MHLALNDATNAYITFDEAGFESQTQALDTKMECMTEVVAPAYAAALHRLRGLRAFLDKDYGAAELHFASARLVDPDYRIPEAIAPEGNPLHERYAQITLDSLGDRIEVPKPKLGSYRINGLPASSRVAGAAVLFQRVSATGRIVSTEFIEAGAPLPEPGERIREPRPMPVAAIAGIGLLGASAAALGMAWASKSQFRDAASLRDPDAIRKAYSRNVGWNVATGSLAAAGTASITLQLVLDARRR